MSETLNQGLNQESPSESEIRALFTWSKLESGRIAEAHSDPRAVAPFRELENLIHLSITPPAPATPTVQSKTTSKVLTSGAEPKQILLPNSPRAALDHELIKRLIQKRPNYHSGRILRGGGT
jgi:hypothetical protein